LATIRHGFKSRTGRHSSEALTDSLLVSAFSLVTPGNNPSACDGSGPFSFSRSSVTEKLQSIGALSSLYSCFHAATSHLNAYSSEKQRAKHHRTISAFPFVWRDYEIERRK